MTELRVGIGVTTFNRAPLLERLIAAIRQFTRRPAIVFVADDGSTDHTASLLDTLDLASLSASNRGIAWNKNRALYYLHTLCRCDVVLLLEDDTFPDAPGWEESFVQAALRWGHINLWPSFWRAAALSGAGTADDPYVTDMLTGQCSAFSAAALDLVGFMDTRFRRYGFEHVEHTRRMIASGMGGVIDAESRNACPLLVTSALTVTEIDKKQDEDALRINLDLYQKMRHEPFYRPAYRTNEEAAILRAEMSALRAPAPARVLPDPGPPWLCRMANGQALHWNPADGSLWARPTEAGWRRLVIVVRGRTAWLRVGPDLPEAGWLALHAPGRAGITAHRDEATALVFVSAPDTGFGLQHDGLFLCCDLNDSGRLSFSRTALDAWETISFDSYALPRLDRGKTPGIAAC